MIDTLKYSSICKIQIKIAPFVQGTGKAVIVDWFPATQSDLLLTAGIGLWNTLYVWQTWPVPE